MAERLRGLLSEHFDVVGVVGGWGELEEGIETVAPDAVVADIAMLPTDDQAAILRIVARHPGTPVVLLSVVDDWALIRMSSSAGTHGYVVKDDVAEELVHALEEVLNGRGYLSTSAAASLRRGRVNERRSASTAHPPTRLRASRSPA
jgi:DNA-binding NarL/FixJ family response regulator